MNCFCNLFEFFQNKNNDKTEKEKENTENTSWFFVNSDTKKKDNKKCNDESKQKNEFNNDRYSWYIE
mgnify:CR=1 FL=1